MKQKIQITVAFVLAIPAILVVLHFFAYALFNVAFLPVPANTNEANGVGFARVFAAGISMVLSGMVLINSGIFDGKQR